MLCFVLFRERGFFIAQQFFLSAFFPRCLIKRERRKNDVLLQRFLGFTQGCLAYGFKVTHFNEAFCVLLRREIRVEINVGDDAGSLDRR